MGRVHKKKIAEYTEASEGEDALNKSKDSKETEDDAVSRNEGVNESEEEADVLNTTTKSAEDEVEDDEDFKSLQGDNAEAGNDENGSAAGNNKKAAKRKAVDKSDKADKKTVDASSDDEPLNNTFKAGNAAKKGRKSAVKGGRDGKGGKQGKTAAKKNSAGPTVEEPEESANEGEEEYEVKEIVDHKKERGVTYYLIRWKGYTKHSDTWEPEATLSCPNIIEKYNKKIADVSNKSQKKGNISSGKKGRAIKIEVKEDPNKEWEVEKIIDYAEDRNGRIFRIRWKGFGAKYDTWEPEKNLFCDDIIKKFMERMTAQSNVSFKELREEPKRTKRLVNENLPRTNYRNPIGRKSKRTAASKKRVYYGDSDE